MTIGALNMAALADWGLQTGLIVSLLIGLVLIIRRPFARYFGAGAAYALWLLPLLRLFMPNMTVPFVTRPVSQTLPVETFVMSPVDAVMPSATVVPVEMSFDIWPLITLIWLVIAVLWFAFQLLKQRAFMADMRRNSTKASDTFLQAITTSLDAVGLRKCPDIRVTERVSGPMVTGIWKPLILLPADFETRFNADQKNFALIHEMAHVKRGDLWVAFIVLAFRAMFWPNPLVHYAAQKLRVDQEAACDASVVARTGAESMHSYAETLVHAAKTAGMTSHISPLGLALSNTPLNSEKDDDDLI